MKIPKILLVLSVLALGGLLSACTGGAAIETWPGLAVAADGSTVYLAAGPQIYTVEPANGLEKSRTPKTPERGASFYAPPAILEDGALVAGGYNHILYRFNPGSEAPSWTFTQSTDRYIAAPVAAGETILAPSADGNLFALSPDGTLRWTFSIEHGFWSSPLVVEDLVYISSLNHKVYALDLATGRTQWETDDLGGEIVAQPVLTKEGLLVVATFGAKNNNPEQSSKLVALDSKDGSKAWEMLTAGWVWGVPALDNGVLYFGDQEGQFYAVDASNGALVWQKQPDAGENRAIVAAPLVTAETIFVVNKAGALYAFDRETGNQRWLQPIGGQIYTSPVLVGDLILVAPMNYDEALLVAVDQNGTRRWNYLPAKE